MNDAVSLKTLLHKFIRETGLERKVHEMSVPSYWREAVGEKIAEISEVKYFENGQMFIEVQAAVWRSELIMRREEIRKAINERCGEEMVREIIIR
ncbi:MAG: DUF721 domain-containing protein [Bacteroidetes bacterium]|nr:DUF721 domain-containing protein [Bacteroidota bacterium]